LSNAWGGVVGRLRCGSIPKEVWLRLENVVAWMDDERHTDIDHDRNWRQVIRRLRSD